MYTGLLMAASVALIAAARQQSWSVNWMPLIAFGVAVAAYVGGQFLDGVQPALTAPYLGGFVIAVMGQQTLHRMVKDMDWFKALEGLNNPKGLAAQPRVGDSKW